MTDVTSVFGRSIAAEPNSPRRWAIIASLALILAAAGAALFVVRGVDTQLADVTRTYEVRQSAYELMISITEAETGQRGYLLTLDRSYLAPYQRAIATLDGNIKSLNELLVGYTSQRQQIASLTAQIDRKRTEMASTVDLASDGRLTEALAILRSDTGQSIMTGITNDLRAFISQEDARLADRNIEVERYRQLLVVAILAALAGAATLAYALFNRTQRQVSFLAQTRNALQLQNEELEAHIQARTADVEEARAHAERERERVEALLQDTNHRIGNSLATVSSLLGLQLSRSKSDEVRNALTAAQSRVHAIASGHRRLRLGADLETTQAGEFLEAVIEDLRANQMNSSPVQFVTDFEPLVINARDATTIGIVLGELVTNALKHAFADGGSGHIWTRFFRNREGVITLAVEDDGRGIGEQDDSSGSGLGSMIIKQLAMQFGGTPEYEAREGGGTRVVVTLPELDRTGVPA